MTIGLINKILFWACPFTTFRVGVLRASLSLRQSSSLRSEAVLNPTHASRISALLLCFFLSHPTAFAQLQDSAALHLKISEHLKVLCSDSLAGRGYQKDGHLKAANYIAKQFQKNDLPPVCDEGYFQPFSFLLNKFERCKVWANQQALTPSKDFLPSSSFPKFYGEIQTTYIEHGLEKNWKKLPLDLKAKWLVIKEGIPENTAENLKDSLKKYTDENQQIERAKAKGAGGIIFLKKKLTHGFSAKQNSFPVLYLNEKINYKKMKIDIYAKVLQQPSQNIIAFQKGEIDSVVVLCAHYDHLGKLEEATFYGANDNASGVAFLLTLSEKIQKPYYSLLWIGFGAEETGLNGSLYYALKKTCIPLEKIKMVLNFDLLGNGQNGIMAVGGQTYPEIYNKVLEINQEQKLGLHFSSRPTAPNREHYPFTLKGLPALFFYTMGGPPHYHDIFDKPEGLEFPIAHRFQTLIFHWLTNSK